MAKLWALLTLGRIEGPVIGTLLVPAGFALGGGAVFGDRAADLGIVTATLGFACFAFVYGFNGITDRLEDSHGDKATRPMVTGEVSRQLAVLYLAALAAVVAAGLLWVDDPDYRYSVAGVVCLGTAYSMPLIRVKRWPPLATVSIAVALHLPLLYGYKLGSGAGWMLPGWVLSSALFCLFVLPLKDIGDEQGDSAAQLGNWSVWLGSQRLALCTAVGLILAAVVTGILQTGLVRVASVGAFLGGAAITLHHRRTPDLLHKLYRRLVRLTIVVAGAVSLLGKWASG